MQQVEIKMISAEASDACLTSACDAVSRHVTGRHLGDQEYLIAPTSDDASNQFFGAIRFRRVDQRHAKRNARAQRFFFLSLRMSSLCETCKALAQHRDDRAIG